MHVKVRKVNTSCRLDLRGGAVAHIAGLVCFVWDGGYLTWWGPRQPRRLGSDPAPVASVRRDGPERIVCHHLHSLMPGRFAKISMSVSLSSFGSQASQIGLNLNIT